ncbi:hypothetical protein IFM61606_09193 [Aspergillus udagawae]|uniref:Uncharacterized protein n=1 Tax=Aspergillus udagawae TaxID=91492 RepID=A0ABQ1B055_9EURO|nr:hypothetical protein IFM61606_09193 [Aspergillus udagawae]GFF34413.1 hypothetical protein IFM51744_02442 [Aspergillus udagawae]GFF91277.1 hypothetical protein IFM53868_06451 [Aspergillus udagawae]GFG15241.1 hypothetical protein IFM5058_07354 [Aspergillus udagawae]
MRSTNILATIPLSATLVSAQCNNRSSCSMGNDGDCFRDCLNQGFQGGRCCQNIGCPGTPAAIATETPKRSDEVIDGNEPLRELLINMGRNDVLKKLDARTFSD